MSKPLVRERALVTLYFFTGIRRGEALALTWDRVYLDRDHALINRSLSVRYGITTPKIVVWRRILARAEVPHRPIGQCRHSFAVLALKQHKPLNWIQRQMGHRTLQMLLKHYWRWIPTDDLSEEEMVFAGERSGAVGPKSCPPFAHSARKRFPKQARKHESDREKPNKTIGLHHPLGGVYDENAFNRECRQARYFAGCHAH